MNFEVVVGSATAVDDSVSLPVTLMYCPKSGKTFENLQKTFKSHLKQLRMCESCLRNAYEENQIFSNMKNNLIIVYPTA